jgi:glycosyltransferase involved in cell wall biosynthesis
MRILCITGHYKPADVYGGPVRTIPMLCEGLVRAGSQVTVFTTNANGLGQSLSVPTDHSVNMDGVEVYYFARSRLARLVPYYSTALGKACQMYMKDFDVAYLCTTWTYPMFAGARAARRASIPYVVNPMGSFMTHALREKWLKKRLYYWLVERHLVNHAAAIRCTSLMEKEQLKRLSLQPQSVVIPEVLDLAVFSNLPSRGRLRSSLGLPPQARLSIFVGRLAPEKRLELTVEAFARVAEQVPEAHLAVIGPEAGSGQALRLRVETLGVEKQVHFLGLLTGDWLLQAYADADLLVQLSAHENFGMVIVEAMASGLPVLVSDRVGLAEDVGRAGTGCVISSRVDEIAQKWHWMLSTPDVEQMGVRGRQLVQQRFSMDVVATQMLDLLSRVSK